MQFFFNLEMEIWFEDVTYSFQMGKNIAIQGA